MQSFKKSTYYPYGRNTFLYVYTNTCLKIKLIICLYDLSTLLVVAPVCYDC